MYTLEVHAQKNPERTVTGALKAHGAIGKVSSIPKPLAFLNPKPLDEEDWRSGCSGAAGAWAAIVARGWGSFEEPSKSIWIIITVTIRVLIIGRGDVGQLTLSDGFWV